MVLDPRTLISQGWKMSRLERGRAVITRIASFRDLLFIWVERWFLASHVQSCPNPYSTRNSGKCISSLPSPHELIRADGPEPGGP